MNPTLCLNPSIKVSYTANLLNYNKTKFNTKKRTGIIFYSFIYIYTFLSNLIYYISFTIRTYRIIRKYTTNRTNKT